MCSWVGRVRRSGGGGWEVRQGRRGEEEWRCRVVGQPGAPTGQHLEPGLSQPDKESFVPYEGHLSITKSTGRLKRVILDKFGK